MQESGTTDVTLFSALHELERKSDFVRSNLPNYNDDQLRELFTALEAASDMAWVLQADIVAEFQSRSTYGTNAIGEIAKFLGIEERRAFELSQIENEILSKAPELRDLPLKKGHYLKALRAKKYGKDPIKVLEYAVDNDLGVRALARYVEDKGEMTTFATFFVLQPLVLPFTAQQLQELQQERYLSPSARIVTLDGVGYLELKEYVEKSAQQTKEK